MQIDVKKYMEFQFELSQSKKLTKRVKTLQKIKKTLFLISVDKKKFVHVYNRCLKLLHL